MSSVRNVRVRMLPLPRIVITFPSGDEKRLQGSPTLSYAVNFSVDTADVLLDRLTLIANAGARYRKGSLFGNEVTYGVILREDKHISPSLRGLLTLLEVPNISSLGQR